MIVLNFALAVFFFLLGVLVCHLADEKMYDECLDNWLASIEKQWELSERISELESELKKEREKSYLTQE